MKKKYSVTLYTKAGRSHKFLWSCGEEKLIGKTPYEILKSLPYIKVKESGKTVVYVDTRAITEISFTERADNK